MKRAVGIAGRAALALLLFLMALALARWAPVQASPPWDVRALPLLGPAVALAVVCALAGARTPSPRRRLSRRLGPRPLLAALLITVAALLVVVALRPAAGLPAEVLSADVTVGRLDAGGVELSGPRLRALPAVRRWTFLWDGALRAPQSGTYRLWATGRGALEVVLDGRVVLKGEGDPLRAGVEAAIGRGAHHLQVRLLRRGAGPRLRLGWTRPDGTAEALPVRFLGAPLSPWWWRTTDALALLAAALLALLVWGLDWDSARALPSPRPVTRAEVAFSTVGHLALAIVMSWPLITDPAHLGVMDRPDGRLNAWILAWDVHALSSAPGRLFQAPAFHPLPDALAFSENLIVPAVLSWPALRLGGPVLGYNFVLLLSMVVSGLAAQLLVRRVSGARLAAFVGGALFGVGAHRWIRLAHLHAQTTLFLPFVLIALDRFWSRRRLRVALLMGLLLALQALSSIYLGAVTALAVLCALLCAVAAGLRGGDLRKLMAGLLLAVALLAPFARPYLRMRAHQGVEWTMEQVALYATTLESYAASGTRLFGRITQAHLEPDRVNDTLFPGVVPLVLGMVGLASAPRRYRAVALLASAAAIVISLGPQTPIYRFLYEHVVLVRGLRALSRFSLLPVLVLAVLSGIALARARWPAVLLALGLALVESTNAPIRYAREEPAPPAVRWLAGREGAAVVLPAGEDDTRAMLDGVAHFRPLVNGDSGFVPRPYTRALELLAAADEPEALRFLRAVGVRHVLTREQRAWPLVAQFGDQRVYELPAGETARVVPAAASAATLWLPQTLLVDLGQPRPVSRLTFELDERPWIAKPRLEHSVDGRSWTRVSATASLADATLSLYADPRRGRGEVHFGPIAARYLRVQADLPAREGALGVAASLADLE